MDGIIRFERVSKSFHLHVQGGTRIAVLNDFSLKLHPGERIALVGPSGAGKSTVLKLLYGNYRTEAGHIWIHPQKSAVDMACARPHQILALRKWTIGYVSQFLRVIPRVPCLQIVMEPLRERGEPEDTARPKAEAMLRRLRIPPNLWSLSPTTFSGGEQQRVNLARGFIADYPVMILDEPTASLDPANTETVKELICEAAKKGTAMLGIFHDAAFRSHVVSRQIELPPNDAC